MTTSQAVAHSPAVREGEWQAIHIFYSSDSTPMLTECVAPLVRDLREQNLISGYFFINYWLEGPHVRLRLKPYSAEVVTEVRRVAEEAIRAFLSRRPALYEVESDYLLDLYDNLFRLEYSDEERTRLYGTDGSMPMRANNSYHHIPYEPEFDKYGGPAGVRLAEWHFERSSDLVLRLLETSNVHVRTVMLGLATQLMMIMSMSFLRDRHAVVRFMSRYHDFWHGWFELSDPDRESRYESNYEAMAEGFLHRFSEIYHAIHAGRLDRLTTFSRDWAAHCAELRERVIDLASAGQLVFPVQDRLGRFRVDGSANQREAVTDPTAALHILMSPYMHMTNNRLGANVIDESYLSFLLTRTLSEGSFPASSAGYRP